LQMKLPSMVDLSASGAAENTSPNPSAPFVPPIKFPAAPVAKAPLPLRAEHDSTSTEVVPSADASATDALTPRLLEALASLDAETANLSALSTPRDYLDDDEADPAWLREAEEAVQDGSAAAPPSVAATVATVETLSRELEVSEEQCRHLRSSAEAQAATTKEVLQQLELTKTAAETTAAAARTIVDDHEKDVSYLLRELRALADPEHLARIEMRLSAPAAALAARRKNAKAAHAHAKRAASPKRPAAGSGARVRPAPLAAPTFDGAAAVSAAPFRAPPSHDDSDAAGWLAPVFAEVLQTTQAVAADVRREVVRAARANSPFRGRAVSPKPGRA